jgi:hypothetical protein
VRCAEILNQSVPTRKNNMISHQPIHHLGQLPRVYSSLSRRRPGSTAAGPAPSLHPTGMPRPAPRNLLAPPRRATYRRRCRVTYRRRRRAPRPTGAAAAPRDLPRLPPAPRDLPAPPLRPTAPPSPAPHACRRIIGRPPPARRWPAISRPRRCFFRTRRSRWVVIRLSSMVDDAVATLPWQELPTLRLPTWPPRASYRDLRQAQWHCLKLAAREVLYTDSNWAFLLSFSNSVSYLLICFPLKHTRATAPRTTRVVA